MELVNGNDGMRWKLTQPCSTAPSPCRLSLQHPTRGEHFSATLVSQRTDKETISRWIHPDVYKGQDYSISKAKKAISDYKKAIGTPGGMAELTVHFCEEAIAFANAYGLDDESFYDSLGRVFKQAVTHTLVLSEAGQEPFLERLGKVMAVGQDMGWGVGDDFADTWAEAGLDA